MRDAGAESSKPSDWFDLIIGTSTGGFLAVLLGVLQLSISKCMSIFKDLYAVALQPPSLLARGYRMLQRSAEQYDEEKLEVVLKYLIENLGHSRDSKLSDFPPSAGVNRCPRVAVLGRLGNNDSVFCFTNFKCVASRQHKPDELLWKVLRATFAPFTAIEIGKLGHEGGLSICYAENFQPTSSADTDACIVCYMSRCKWRSGAVYR
jgi:hypothetical protein